MSTLYGISIVTVTPGGSFNGTFHVNSSNIITDFYENGNPTSILDTTSFNGTDPNTHTYDGTNWGNIYLTSLGTVRTGGSVYIISSNGSNATTLGSIGNTPITMTATEGACFNEGTKILCLNKVEEYIPIENLKKGDIVKSYKHGYRKIDLIGKNYLFNNPDNFSHCMYKMAKTDTNELTEDLIVTGGHSILVDKLGKNKKLNKQLFGGQTLKIDDKYLLLSAASDKFEKVLGNDKYTYYHLVLENNGDDEERFGIWANGVLTETPSKNFFVQSHFILI